MAKIVRLTEADLTRLINKVINESKPKSKSLREWRGTGHPGIPQENRDDFYKKLEEALEFAGEDSENLYMSLYNKIEEWMQNEKYERGNRH